MSVTEEQNCPENDTVYMGLAAEVMAAGMALGNGI